jgi:signal recognition particle subunit SRP54
MGGLKTILKMFPKSKQFEDMLSVGGISDKTVTKHIAIIRSMTKKERRNYKLLNGSRKKRIAAGSGTTVQEVNKIIKQHESTLDIFKKMRKNGLSKLVSTARR